MWRLKSYQWGPTLKKTPKVGLGNIKKAVYLRTMLTRTELMIKLTWQTQWSPHDWCSCRPAHSQSTSWSDPCRTAPSLCKQTPVSMYFNLRLHSIGMYRGILEEKSKFRIKTQISLFELTMSPPMGFIKKSSNLVKPFGQLKQTYI